MRDRCEVCGLDLRAHDAGDGAAVGVILLLGAIVVGLAFWVEFRFSPPLWLHAILWPVVTVPLAVADDAAGEGGAGGAAVPPSGDRDGIVTGRLRRLLWPGVMTAAMLAVLLGLGTWQVERLHWKRALLAQIARAEAAPGRAAAAGARAVHARCR